MTPDAEWTVGIDGIAAGGDGVGRLADGRVVFVPRTAPGDRVSVRTVRDGGRWLRAEAITFEAHSPHRRPAPCRLYERCGGCQLQHLQYPAQIEAASRVVGDALRRIGGLEVSDPEVRPAEREFGYRNRVAFTLKRLRGGRVVAGFHARGHPGRIVEVRHECLLPEAPIAEVWPALREAWGAGASRLPAGRELRLTLRSIEEGVLLAIDGGRAWAEGADQAAALRAAVPGLAAIWHRAEGGDWVLAAGRPDGHDTTGGERVVVRPGAFTQVNREVAGALHDAVRAAVGDPAGRRIVDGYCGVGLHGRRLARDGARVVGLELDPAAVEAAREGAPAGFRVIEGAAEETLPTVLPADVVIVNPPRAGLHRGVPEALRHDPPATIVYVSCDPATLARDLERLGSRWTLRAVTAFDLFPQTSHIETVVTLVLDPKTTDS
ncbi:23S rRNA (uracil(1939)-C(5))-methyltransferase RlmD [Gaopeijia maritima]|uniref:23S rRNA (uracil(1939)-C(5))-methyltransferase RlmD n=1 Tax=Gaopeijia maritima TaxID=3119007 RepID=UPI0032489356